MGQATMVIGAVMGIVLLVLSIIAYAQMAGFVSDYQNVANSWTSKPVSNVYFAPSCGGDEAVSSYWPGLYPACDCSQKTSGSNSTSSDTTSCTQQQLNDNCRTLTSLVPDPISLNAFVGQALCLQRSDPTALQRTQDPTACTSSEVVCGSGTENPFCWPSGTNGNTLDCPVTDFIIDTADYTVAAAGADSKTAIGTTGSWLYVKRGGRLSTTTWPDSSRQTDGAYAPTGLPLMDIVLQPGHQCTLDGCGYGGRSSSYSTMSSNYATNHPNNGYTLKTLPCDGGCKRPDVSGGSVSPNGYDLRFTRTFWSKTEQSLYTESNVPTEFITTDASYVWQIQIKSEIRWNPSCPETRAKVVDRKTDVTKVKNAQTALLVFGILSFIFLTLYFPCIEAFGSKEQKDKIKNPNLACKVIIKVATLVCTIVTVAIAYATLSFWDSVNKSGGCADPLTNETFKVLGDKFGELSYKNAISTAASSATSFLDVAVAIFKRCT